MRLFLILLIFSAANLQAQDSFPQFKLTMLLDGRIIVTGKEESWLNRSLGKSRYGGDGESSKTVARLSQASFLLSTSLTEALSARAHINIDAEPEQEIDGTRINVIEAFAGYRFFSTPMTRMRIRGGIFIPPISLENTDTAWTSPYTITASAINSWIGEEVRTTGTEVSWVFTPEQNEITLRAAIFWQNDPAATLLAWRGWTLQDRQTGYTDHLPLAPIPSLQPGGLFPRQPDFAEPFREVDGHPGYYAGANWTQSKFDINMLFYNNRGDPMYFDGVQYAWQTNFLDAGTHFRFPKNFELLAQYMKGNSVMGFGNMVDIDFSAWFVLSTLEYNQHRFSVRYDDFEVNDQDRFVLEDNNNEEGWALTGAWIWKFEERFRLAVEYLHIRDERPVRASMNLPVRSTQNQLQASVRIELSN
ncbi:MAG TPA: hypothetical protein VLH08_07990 [Acidobacteriota bacterium]|nr:hypothetical protein [Acidobacteriota bacterium]